MVSEQIKQQIKDLFLRNRRETNGYQYTVPSPSSYPYQWLWDSCFHAIALLHFDVESAKKEIQSAVAHQFKSGMIPHMTYWQKHEQLPFDWGVDGTSAITQPPLLAYAVWRIYKQDNDKQFLNSMYDTLSLYYRYLLTRDPRSHHLIGIINPDESGEDNSPRFDIPLGLLPQQTAGENNEKRFALFQKNKACDFDAAACMRNFFWVKDVPFNVYMIENLTCLSDIATVLGKHEDADFFQNQANLIREAMRTYLFEDGVYWSIYGHDHTKIKVKTWALFAPLVADAFSEEEAKRLVHEHLLAPDAFWCKYPVPTTALSEPAYHPHEPTEGPPELHPNWRGSVWMAVNWFVYRGLKRYGFDEAAHHIRDTSTVLIEESGFREYYHPQTGEGLGAKNFTWGGLILDMET